MTIKEYLDLYSSYAERETVEKLDAIIKYNNELVEKYPFLIVRSFDGSIPKDIIITWLGDMPEGWRISFSEQMCDEIKKALVDYDNKNGTDLLHEYRIVQIKEKFGGLRWYDDGNIPEVAVIISKYEKLSEHTCIKCGDEAAYSTKGWIAPYCETCASEIFYNYNHPKNKHKFKFESLFYELKEDKSILDN